MEHEGHRQRMRERYLQQGLEGFAPHEVLELMLFYAIPQRNVNPLAHRLIDRFGSLEGVLNANPRQLMQVEGVGESVATFLTLFPKVMRQAERTRAEGREKLATRRAAVEHCRCLLLGEKREMFYAICLNGQMETLGDALIATGSLSDVPAYPRLVAEAVLTYNAHGVIFCHNHPGGSAIPSQADLDATSTLARLLQDMEVVLIDHVIVAETEAFSMVRNQLIEQTVVAGGVQTRVASSAGELRLGRQLKLEGKQTMEEL